MASASSAASLRHLLRRPLRPPLLRPPLLRPTRRLLCASSTLTHGGDSSTSTSSDGALGVVDLNPPRGTRDFPPEEMRLRTWLFDNFREVSRTMAFEEVDFPVLEPEALFVRKAGEEITQQLYNFEDKGGRRVVLRPEITPSLARLVIKQGYATLACIQYYLFSLILPNSVHPLSN
jgi:histidyl-tRNA synthetase